MIEVINPNGFEILFKNYLLLIYIQKWFTHLKMKSIIFVGIKLIIYPSNIFFFSDHVNYFNSYYQWDTQNIYIYYLFWSYS